MKPLSYTAYVLHSFGLITCIGVTTLVVQWLGLDAKITPAVAAGIYLLSMMRERA